MNKQTRFQKIISSFSKRWMDEDFPGGMPRFQIILFAKDLAIFCLLPICAVLIYKFIEISISTPGQIKKTNINIDPNKKYSQIIAFSSANRGNKALSKRAPGTIVRVRLLNAVETFNTAPVHAQVMDQSLGEEYLGGTLIGDATPQEGYGRINIDFKFLRHPKQLGVAMAIAARGMSQDGTLGLIATKKEGLFARAVIRSDLNGANAMTTSSSNQDLKTLIAKSVASGLIQEFQSESNIANNKAQVLTLKPMTEFLVELTDFFPGQK